MEEGEGEGVPVGLVLEVSAAEKVGVPEGVSEEVPPRVAEWEGVCEPVCVNVPVRVAELLSVLEVVLVELPPSVKDDVGVAVRLGVTVRLGDVVGVALAAASLYSVPP